MDLLAKLLDDDDAGVRASACAALAAVTTTDEGKRRMVPPPEETGELLPLHVERKSGVPLDGTDFTDLYAGYGNSKARHDALERVSKLFVEGYISESEFAMPPEEDTEGNPARSDGEDEDEDTDPEDVGEMDIEGWDAIEKFPFKDSKEII